MSEQDDRVVSQEKLQKLADSWREERENRDPNTLSNVATLAKEECARELEEVLENNGE